MSLKVQRFDKYHPFYTDKVIHNTKADAGVVGDFNSVFGQLLWNGVFVCFTMERKDTLIPEGEYDVTYHDSPSNHCVCPHIHSASCPAERYILIHIANWVFQLRGCTAVGLGINKDAPGLTMSGDAFKKLNALLNNQPTKIIYETLKTK